MAEFEKVGVPIISINLANKVALGGEYYRFEIATAIAGMVIGINSFNEPNVAESKKNSNDLIKEWGEEGSFKKPEMLLAEKDLTIYGSDKFKQIATKKMATADLMDKFFSLIEKNNYTKYKFKLRF